MDDGLTELDFMTDEEVMARVAESREAQRQMEAVRGIDLMGARNWTEDEKLSAFMGIFHPERTFSRWCVSCFKRIGDDDPNDDDEYVDEDGNTYHEGCYQP